jgi:hypothetical protein
VIARNPWLMELNWARPYIATPCRVPRYKNNDIVKSTLPSTANSSLSASRCCSINDSSGCGAPLNSQGHRASRVPGRALTLRLAMGCREFSSVPKNNARRLIANKRIACSVLSIMGKRFIVCGVEHFRRLLCAMLIRRIAFEKYWFLTCCKADCVARGWRFSALRLDA